MRDSAAALELLIERNVPGGDGMARSQDGRVMFVPGALVGDRVFVEQSRQHKGVAFAEKWHLLSPGPQRVDEPCPVARQCGGCDWMALRPEAQEEQKRGILLQALRRTAKLSIEDEQLQWLASPRALQYRERIRLRISGKSLGFYAAGTHQLVPIRRCLVARPELEESLQQLGEFVAADGHSASITTALQAVSELELRYLPACEAQQAAVLVHFYLPQQWQSAKQARNARKRRPQAQTGQLRKLDAQGRASLKTAIESLSSLLHVSFSDEAQRQRYRYQLGEYRRDGEQGRDERAMALWCFAQAGAFSQVNAEMNLALIARVLDVAQAAGARSFLDLYCGSGNFSLPLLHQGLDGLGIEVSSEAIDMALSAYEQQRGPGWGSGRFKVRDCAAAASELRQQSARFDLVVVDPPRAGATGVVEHLAAVCRDLLVMVSCDPVTLARDLGHLLPDFELQSVHACDMFPQTHHVESLVVLRRRSESS